MIYFGYNPDIRVVNYERDEEGNVVPPYGNYPYLRKGVYSADTDIYGFEFEIFTVTLNNYEACGFADILDIIDPWFSDNGFILIQLEDENGSKLESNINSAKDLCLEKGFDWTRIPKVSGKVF
jgi:hypothetical protein